MMNILSMMNYFILLSAPTFIDNIYINVKTNNRKEIHIDIKNII